MNKIDNKHLESLLESNDKNIVVEGESETLEFKEIFDRSNKELKAKYCKELAALHNTKGGYLVFGINDKTNEIVGLNNFKEPNSADIANDINEYFKPSFGHNQKSFTIKNKTVFVIYVAKREDIPTVCVREHQDILKESTIYVRYSSQSSGIHAEDLIRLLSSLKSQDSNRLADMKAAEMTIDFKPKLTRGISGLEHDGRIKLSITNSGKRLLITGVSSSDDNFIIAFYARLPYWWESNINLALHVTAKDSSNLNNQSFEGYIIVRNEWSQDYQIPILFRGPSVKIDEPELI